MQAGARQSLSGRFLGPRSSFLSLFATLWGRPDRRILLYLRRTSAPRGYVEPSVDHLTLGEVALRLLAVIVLVLANAFMVAAEFALVGARKSRIDALAARGNTTARIRSEERRVGKGCR